MIWKVSPSLGRQIHMLAGAWAAVLIMSGGCDGGELSVAAVPAEAPARLDTGDVESLPDLHVPDAARPDVGQAPDQSQAEPDPGPTGDTCEKSSPCSVGTCESCSCENPCGIGQYCSTEGNCREFPAPCPAGHQGCSCGPGEACLGNLACTRIGNPDDGYDYICEPGSSFPPWPQGYVPEPILWCTCGGHPCTSGIDNLLGSVPGILSASPPDGLERVLRLTGYDPAASLQKLSVAQYLARQVGGTSSCDPQTDSCAWEIAVSSFDEQCGVPMFEAALASNGALVSGPNGQFAFDLAPSAGNANLPRLGLKTTQTRVVASATFDAEGMAALDGVIGGAVTLESFFTAFDEAPYPEGATVPKPITRQLLQVLLKPDLDVLDASGAFGADGVLDSCSVGLGFTAVRVWVQAVGVGGSDALCQSAPSVTAFVESPVLRVTSLTLGDDQSPAGLDLDGCTLGDAMTHVVSMQLPTTPAAFKCDANNDDKVDNNDGNINLVLGNPLLAGQFNVNELLAQKVAQGDVVLLAAINGSWLQIYRGEKVDTTALGQCLDFTTSTNAKGEVKSTTWDGTNACTFAINPESLDDYGWGGNQLFGATVADGSFSVGPDTFDLSLPLGGVTLDVEIKNGRVEGAYSGAFRLEDGHLCGQIPYSKVELALNKVCTDDPTQSLCSYKNIALPLIKNGCANQTDCSFIVDLETAQAKSVTAGAGE